MCGIFALEGELAVSEAALKCADKVAHRGPDEHAALTFRNTLLCFYRLAINGRSHKGMQPIEHPKVGAVVCNGEIYNCRFIKENSTLSTVSASDCEAVLHALHDWDFRTALQRLDGVFAFVAVLNDGRVVAARDMIGVRPLFWGTTAAGNRAFASEAKALLPLCENVSQFPAGAVWDSQSDRTVPYWNIDIARTVSLVPFERQESMRALHAALSDAVRKRMMSDRPIGCFLSGGLDSSVVAALVLRECLRTGRAPPRLFTISLDRGECPDLVAARKVSDHLGLPLTEVTFSPEDGIRVLGQVIYSLETFDTTTIRASVPQWLLSRWVSENTDVKVLFSGEGADELLNGYQYMKRAPSDLETREESIRLLRELPWYDVLRTDRTTAAFGLEVRVPFLDKHFVQVVMGCQNCHLSALNGGMEKQLLRETFAADDGLLPADILFRRKDAFSDAVGYSWVSCLQKYAKNFETDVSSSMTAEEALYIRRFDLLFGERREFLKGYHRWMPKAEWFENKVSDPSARVLDCYDA
tara:strand:+ start:139 stop:1716 length:1578 start_codon:yes stop_codon:yes gene_type:complete